VVVPIHRSPTVAGTRRRTETGLTCQRVSVNLRLVETYEKVLTAIADPTRRAVLERLRFGPRPVGELAAGLPVSRPAVSQHLKVLKRAGLVTERPRGTRRFYEIDPDGLAALRTYLEGFWGDVLAAFETAADAHSERRK
jgi:DNA-binding transcriptional ArsR family regulator